MKGNSKKWFDSVASERIKVSIATINALKDNKAVKYGPKFISEAFQVFFTYMAKTLLQKLLLPRSKHGIDSISKFYKDLDMKPTIETNSFIYCSENIKSTEISQAAGIDNLPGRFLKDGAITEIAKFVTFPLNRGFFLIRAN